MNYENKAFAAERIFNVNKGSFDTVARELFAFQIEHNPIYQQYCFQVGCLSVAKKKPSAFPFLPISFFKTHDVVAFEGVAETAFTSSGTTGTSTSKHQVKDLLLYEQSFLRGFQRVYGSPDQYAFLCLLPSYLQREGSSLIYMAERLVQLSADNNSGFYLDAKSGLMEILKRREQQLKKTILLGVTYALLDFADEMPIPLQHTVVMETGGMKGRRQELTRSEVHEHLKKAFDLNQIHSEYGMTELLSQAYALGDGLFECPPWMKVLVRAEDDPFDISTEGTGLLCIIDLANVYSCSFIETADVGRVGADGRFEVLGRLDNSDIRGCSLLVL